MATSLGKNQPFRYRGYVYDTETQWYYLQSRYYDPNTCRFISGDIYLSTGQGVLGHNSYAYCGNNPIVRLDAEGDFWHIVIGAVVGAVIGGVSAALSGGDIVDVLIGSAAGAATGALAASGACVVVQAVAGAGISMASNAGQQVNKIVNGKQVSFNVGDMFMDGAIGLVAGAVGGNGASYGNSKPIMQHGKDLVRRIGKNGFKKAVSYYAKVAHRQGGDFVLKALAQSMKYSAYGSAVSVIKTRYGNKLKPLLFFLAAGFPKNERDLSGWTAYESFMSETPPEHGIGVHVSAYTYGGGEVFIATPEEVAYFKMRADRREEASLRDTYSLGVLMHEMNHQFGAPDHYHEVDKVTGKCKSKDICSTCGSNKRPATCIMNQSRQAINGNNIMCPGCKYDIFEHLKKNK